VKTLNNGGSSFMDLSSELWEIMEIL